MSEVQLTRDLVRQGFSGAEVARMTRAAELVRIRRGAYGSAGFDADARATHRRLIQATMPLVATDAVVSHMSAAVLHGLPIWTDRLGQVHLTRSRSGGGQRRRYVRVTGLPLDEVDVVTCNGMATTSLARTVLDLACALPMERSVAVGDGALRFGLTPAELQAQLDRAVGRHGVPAARRAIAFLDPRSESAQESVSRVLFWRHGLAAPQLQYEVFSHTGTLVGRTDFAWPELRTLGEFDGRIKYGRALRPGQDVEEVLYQEKCREDALRDLDWQVVRWVSPDLRDPADLLVRLNRAFERGRKFLS